MTKKTSQTTASQAGIFTHRGLLLGLAASSCFVGYPVAALSGDAPPANGLSLPAIALPQQPFFTGARPSTASIPRSGKMPRSTPAEAAKAAATSGANIQFSRKQPALLPPVPRGQAPLQHNELDLARQHFEAELRRDPRQVNALLTLAAIALRQQRPGDAEWFYRQALFANPGNPDVLAAALNGSSAGADQQATESRLKVLLAEHPASAALHFALGNVHARQARWHEAQQAYFNAVALEGGNPDYLFNLAVSLDHLRQARAAAQYYRLAIDASALQPGAFANEQAETRLGELQAEFRP